MRIASAQAELGRRQVRHDGGRRSLAYEVRRGAQNHINFAWLMSSWIPVRRSTSRSARLKPSA